MDVDNETTQCNTTSNEDFRWAVRGIGIAMCVLSILGALVIILTFIRWKDVRTMSRRLLVFISIADFFTAAGNLTGLAFNLDQPLSEGDGNLTRNLTVFEMYHPPFCVTQSFITTTSSLSSFFWTCILAWYLYLSLVHIRPDTFRRPWHFALMHFIGWGIPLACGIAALTKGALGADNKSVSAGWCFITQHDGFSHRQQIIWQLMVGKLWEILTYVIMIILYARIKIFVSKVRPTILSCVFSSAHCLMVVYFVTRIWSWPNYWFPLSTCTCKSSSLVSVVSLQCNVLT